jgi:hypothetical protein
MKTPVINSDDYVVYLEHYQGITIIHCDCFKWTRAVKQNLSQDWEQLVKIHRKPIYAIHETDDLKHLKFIQMMGFEFHNTFVGADNKERHLFVRKYHGN